MAALGQRECAVGAAVKVNDVGDRDPPDAAGEGDRMGSQQGFLQGALRQARAHTAQLPLLPSSPRQQRPSPRQRHCVISTWAFNAAVQCTLSCNNFPIREQGAFDGQTFHIDGLSCFYTSHTPVTCSGTYSHNLFSSTLHFTMNKGYSG